MKTKMQIFTLIKTALSIFYILSFVFLLSCEDRNQKALKTHFEYINLTQEDLELKLYKAEGQNPEIYTIPKNGSKTFTYIADDIHGDPGITTPFQDTYKVVIKFLVKNQCVENFSKLKIVQDYDNFSPEMYKNHENTLVYHIDNEEYVISQTCP